jgi:hypothetical protein
MENVSLQELQELLRPMQQDIAEIKGIVKADHDVLILTRAKSEENSRDIDRLFEKTREVIKLDDRLNQEVKKIDTKIWRIAIAIIVLGGGSVGLTKIVGF